MSPGNPFILGSKIKVIAGVDHETLVVVFDCTFTTYCSVEDRQTVRWPGLR